MTAEALHVRRGEIPALEWVRKRMQELEALGGRLRSDAALGMQSVGPGEAYVLAYLGLVDAARRSHDHARDIAPHRGLASVADYATIIV